tara:strand:+ start:157 stop:621 length:465 start_codon:yes stop_codon:yes gene_type:complete
MKLKGLLSAFAPTLGSAIGGPLGKMAVTAIAGKLGVSDTEEAVTQALETATVEQRQALSEADQAFAIRMRELDIDSFKVQTEDVQNARETHKGLIFPQLFASAFLMLFFGYIFLITVSPPAQADLALSNLIVGNLMAVISGISGYLYGSQNGKK